MASLKVYVHVTDDEGVVHAFGPGDDVPDWAREQISNPDVWEDDTHVGGTREAPSDGGEPESQEPPRAGRGSGRDEWVRFAQAHGVDVGDDDSRDDIIAALTDRGVVEG